MVRPQENLQGGYKTGRILPIGPPVLQDPTWIYYPNFNNIIDDRIKKNLHQVKCFSLAFLETERAKWQIVCAEGATGLLCEYESMKKQL
jgi:hypothetical protein